MKSVIDVLQVNEPKTGVGKNGKPYSITECECVVTRADQSRFVAVLTLSKDLEGKVSPGQYEASFDLVASWRDRRLTAEIVSMEPVRRPAPAAPVKA